MGVPFNEVYGRMQDAARFKNSSALARSLAVTPQALSNYKKRGVMPTDMAVRFAELHGLSIDWLLTGKGEGPESGQLPLYTKLDLGELTPDEAIYIGKLLKLLRGEKFFSKAVRSYIDSCSNEVAA